MINSIFYRHIE